MLAMTTYNPKNTPQFIKYILLSVRNELDDLQVGFRPLELSSFVVIVDVELI